jgi:hypothetical protein
VNRGDAVTFNELQGESPSSSLCLFLKPKTMGATCSRKAHQEVQSEEEPEYPNKEFRQQWPSPNNTNGPPPVDSSVTHKKLEGMEKAKQEPQAVTVAAVTVDTPVRGSRVSHQVDSNSGDAVSSGEDADDNREERKRLSRMLSEKASSVRFKTSFVAKKGASRVRSSLCLLCGASVCSSIGAD